MFGIYRYILALMVMIAHLAPAQWLHLGIYAVTGFFTLSGYLMTMVLDTHYSRIEDGWRKYVLNRFLRVMPAYWTVLLLSVVVVFCYPDMAQSVHKRMQMPQSWIEWLNHITVVGLTGIMGDVSPQNLVPPSWSLSIELVYWAFMPALLLTPRRFRAWGVFAFFYAGLMICWGKPLQLRYYALPAGALPFYLGAYVYRAGCNRLPVKPWQGLVMIALTLVYFFGAPWLFSDASYYGAEKSESRVLFAGLYIATFLNAITIYLLGRIKLQPSLFASLDKGMGHLAYPIFLLHTVVAVLVVVLGFDCGQVMCQQDWRLFWLSLPFVNLAAVLLWLLIERPLVVVRRKVRC
jgi:peptidoglycan/LPS O-acetylase OafA/YrhL